MNPRLCISWLGRFLQGLLCLALLGQLAILTCFLTLGHLPIPSTLANTLLAKASPPSFSVQIGELYITPSGLIRGHSLEIYNEEFTHSIITADAATVNFHLKPLDEKPLTFESVSVEGGTFYMPANLSADGSRAPILEQVTFFMIFHQARIKIESLAAKFDDLKLRGALAFPRSSINAPADQAPATSSLNDLYRLLRKAQNEFKRANFLTEPSLQFWILLNEDRSVYLNTTLSSPTLQHAQFSGKNLRLKSAFTYHEGTLHAEKAARLNIEQINSPHYNLSAEEFSAYISKENWRNIMQKEWPILELSAKQIEWKTHRLETPHFTLTSSDGLPDIQLHGSARKDSSTASIEGTLNTETQSGHVDIRATADFASYIPESIKIQIPEFQYDTPPFVDLSLQLGPNLKLISGSGIIQAEDLQVEQIRFDHIRSHISFSEHHFRIDEALIQRNKQWLDLGFNYHFDTNDYGVRLVGSAVPYEYNAILPSWWEVIFRDFEFTASTQSLGDFIIYGKTTQPVADLFFGHVRATHAFYRNVPIDTGELFVRGRQRYVEIDQMHVVNGQGEARGKIAFTSLDDDINDLASIRYNIEGQIGVEHAQSIFGGTISEILADFKMDKAPNVKLNGVQFGEAYPKFNNKSFFQIEANSTAPFSYKGINIDSLKLDLIRSNKRAALRNITFKFADGNGSGSADILTPENYEPSLRFNFSLAQADKDLALKRIPLFNQTETETSDHPVRFDLLVNAEGPIDDPLKYQGIGNLSMQSKELGAIQLLGPLSKILQNTRLGFTSLILEDLQADFRIAENVLEFNDIEINGPQTRIHANGDLTLPDQTIDLSVSANLIANIGDSDSGIRKFGNVLNPFLKPLPNLLTFKVTGTLEDQKWRSLYDPRNLIPIF